MCARPAVTCASALISLLLVASVVSAATLQVPGSYSTIQAAIDAAVAGDEVVIASGTYHERLNFGGKAITVRSTNPYDPLVVAATIVNGDAGGTVVTFNHSETATSVLTGLTITNGKADGGGILCSSCSPTIRGNIISGNACGTNGHGAGIFCNGGAAAITGNTITGNTSANGAGICLYGGSAAIGGNFIRGNSGSGIYCSYSGATITGNLITANSGAALGGGILAIGGTDQIVGNTLHGNGAGAGGGICFYGGSPRLRNTIVTSSTGGAGVCCQHDAAPTITYCNVYGNAGGNYSGLTDPVGLNGNVAVDPRYADTTSFRLQSTVGRWSGTSWVMDGADSPCIDGGDPTSPYSNEPAPHGYRVNMGYDGNTGYASKTKVLVYIAQTGMPYQTIQAAINAATSGQTVVVNPATYHERLNFNGKSIAVCAAKPNEPTVINGDAGGSVVSFKSGEGSGATLSGFTLTGGTGTGAGIYCYNASPGISGCTITGNAAGTAGLGGGIYCGGGHATLSGNKIQNNSAPTGGGIYVTSSFTGTISGNTINGNTGSGIYSNASSPVISANIITANSGSTSTGTSLGGGLACASGTPQVIGNTLSGNTATLGGGVYLYGGTPNVRNNIIVTSPAGYGLYIDRYTYPTIKYNDLYDNLPANWGNTFDHTGSDGNISRDPLFVAEFRLASTGGHYTPQGWVKDSVDSPCLDAGDPASAYSAEPVYNGGRINLGYDGNTGSASRSPIPSVTRNLPRGEGIPTTTAITLRFSVPMKQGSVQSALYLNGQRAPEGSFTWSGLKLTYKPKVPLQSHRRYQVKLRTTARSRVGVPLPKEKVWCFTTETAATGTVAVTARPLAAGAALSISLSAAASVTATVRNLAGRPVAVLSCGTLPAGTHHQAWSGRCSSGVKAPAGAYVVEVEARGKDGTQSRAVAPLSLSGWHGR